MSNIQDEAYSEAMDEIQKLKRENAQLKKLNLMTDEEIVLELKAEITRLLEREALLKSLLNRAADALEEDHDVIKDFFSKSSIRDKFLPLIAELQKAAE